MDGRKLLAFDLDRTLICVESGGRQGQIVSEKNKAALRQAAEIGCINSIVTGRSFMDIAQVIIDNKDIRYIAVSNGSIIWDKVKKCKVYQKLISSETMQRVLEQLKNYKCAVVLYYSDKMVSSYWDFPVMCSIGSKGNYFPLMSTLKYRIKYLKQTTYVWNLSKYISDIGDGIAKCDIKLKNEKDTLEVMKKLQGIEEIECAMFLGRAIEVTAGGVNKGAAIRTIAQLENVSCENCYAFGDSENDLSMRGAVKTLVCMGDGCEELKATADYITLKSTEDGVANAIERLIICEKG